MWIETVDAIKKSSQLIPLSCLSGILESDDHIIGRTESESVLLYRGTRNDDLTHKIYKDFIEAIKNKDSYFSFGESRYNHLSIVEKLMKTF